MVFLIRRINGWRYFGVIIMMKDIKLSNMIFEVLNQYRFHLLHRHLLESAAISKCENFPTLFIKNGGNVSFMGSGIYRSAILKNPLPERKSWLIMVWSSANCVNSV